MVYTVRRGSLFSTVVATVLLLIGTGSHYFVHERDDSVHYGLFTVCTTSECQTINVDCSIDFASGGVTLPHCGNFNAARAGMIISCISVLMSLVLGVISLFVKKRPLIFFELGTILVATLFGFMGCTTVQDYITRDVPADPTLPPSLTNPLVPGSIGVDWGFKAATAGWIFAFLASIKVLIILIENSNFRNPGVAVPDNKV